MIVLNYCTTRINNLLPPSQEARSLRNVLDKLVLMYSLTCLEKHLSTFYQGLYIAQHLEEKNHAPYSYVQPVFSIFRWLLHWTSNG